MSWKAEDATQRLISQLQEAHADLDFSGKGDFITLSTIENLIRGVRQGSTTIGDAQRIAGDAGVQLNTKPQHNGKRRAVPATDGVRCEMDIARKLVEVHGHRLRYAHGLGWLVWAGTHWERDSEERARELAKDIVTRLRVEGATTQDERLTKLAFRTGKDAGIRSVLSLARSDPKVRVRAEELDADPHLLACRNGTLDLRTRKLRDADPQDLITRLCPVEYDPEAEAPLFHKFLTEVQPNQEVREYLARLFGYAAVGVVRDHVLGVLWGPGANGKSVLADVVTYVLGDYAKPGPPSLIVRDGKHTPHPTDVASCVGSRLVIVHETKRGASFDASKVKLLTGGDRLTARFMKKDFFDFDPTHTLVMLSNYKPQADANDAALWRRVQLVPFEVVIPEERQDRELAEKIRASEAPGVLRWIVKGAHQWQVQGLKPPDVVREQTAAYRDAEDVIGAFVEERTVSNKAAKVKAGVLYAAFKDWCQSQGMKPVRGNDFFAELQARGFRREKTSTGKIYHGLGLIAADDEYDWHE